MTRTDPLASSLPLTPPPELEARRGPEHWEGSHPDDFDNGWDEAMDWVYAMIAAELEALPND
jgi:hypothetical protein